jgi:hypothetical protein
MNDSGAILYSQFKHNNNEKEKL